jgi:hypothetical protein
MARLSWCLACVTGDRGHEGLPESEPANFTKCGSIARRWPDTIRYASGYGLLVAEMIPQYKGNLNFRIAWSY